jgi:hypothetical protein
MPPPISPKKTKKNLTISFSSDTKQNGGKKFKQIKINKKNKRKTMKNTKRRI